VATLLFADLVGFTSMGETHDPEVVGALVGDVFARLGAEVTRYEGTIEKFAGDAMLAVFGVPSIHEDDPERAVRAGLEMQAAVAELAASFRAQGRPEPALRIGIETGEVLVDLGRARSERDLFVTGDAVNTAARLQTSAAPGAVVIGPTTYAATRHVVEYEELEASELKGKSRAVAAWRAIAVKARRSGERAPLGIEAPLVGRDEEIALLKETVRRTVADGRPHVLTVIGAAGVGKSRLSWELEKYLDGLPQIYHWRKGRCLAYAQASYSALADIVKVDARIMDDDAPATALAKLDDRIREIHGPEPDPMVPVALRAVLALGPLTNVPAETLFEAWRCHFDAVAAIAPLVLVMEDIHWADEGLLDVIEYLARWGEGPVVILCLARHELLERRPGWGGGMRNAATIVLEPLEPGETSRLVDGLLGSAVPSDLRERIVALADGNPLFSEELVRMFVDRGVLRYTDGHWELVRAVDEVEVPGSIHAVLAARLDGLPPAEKRLAQNAAVVGRIFWDGVLAHLSRQGPAATADLLRRLRAKELVVPRQPSSLAGAAEFGFRHVLIRDVAYDSLPKRDRAALHLDVAQWAEEALGERREEFVELLAAHYVAALRYEQEFGTDPAHLCRLREQTLELTRQAAERAYRLGQLDSATAWIRTAMEQGRRLDLDPNTFADLVESYYELGFANESGENAAPIVREALDRLLAAPAGDVRDRDQIARLRAAAGRTLYLAQRPDEARAVLDEGLASAPTDVGRAELLAMLGWVEWRLGHPQAAVPLLDEAVRLATEQGADAVLRHATHDLGVAYGWLNRPEALPLVERSFELAKAAGDAILLDRCYINLPSTMVNQGQDWRSIVALLEEGLDRSRRRSDRVGTTWIAGNYAELLVHLGRVTEARALYEEAVDAATVIGDAELRANRVVGVAMATMLLGDRERTHPLLTDEVRRLSRNEAQTKAFLATVEAWLAWPDGDRAIERLLSECRGTERLAYGDVAGMALARLGLRTGRRDAVTVGTDLARRMLAGSNGPRTRLLDLAAAALAVGSPAAARQLGDVGAQLAELGYRLLGADALADAAVLAAAVGEPADGYASQARELFAACSIVSPYGDPLAAVGAATASA
jgi:class 3 adenylate cyclase/tetratricopeptide (TPR) repeat protein